MSDLISRSALLERLAFKRDHNRLYQKSTYPGLESAISQVKKAPTVDVVPPVVHGRWIWNEENECWVCSNCELSALNDYRGNSTDSNYCPSCGAKMAGGNDG